MIWALDTLKPTNGGTAPPARPHFLLLFKEFHQHFNCMSPQEALVNPPHYAFIPAPCDGHTITQTYSTFSTLPEAPLQSLFQSWKGRKFTFKKVCHRRMEDIVCIMLGCYSQSSTCVQRANRMSGVFLCYFPSVGLREFPTEREAHHCG